MTDLYTTDFYADQQDGSVISAKIVLPIVLKMLPPIKSAVDFGCGVGGWLAELKQNGVSDIHGIDGDWVNPKMLKIPVNNFLQTDLDKPIKVNKQYDLAMSLEVAEHLKSESAATFVKSLCNASDLVLFSAAIPGQGGTGHINEQWHLYWIKLFAEQDYKVCDVIRHKIWDNKQVETCYRQNILLFAKDTNQINGNFISPYADVHPDMLSGVYKKYLTIHAQHKKQTARRKKREMLLYAILIASNLIWVIVQLI